MAVQYPVGNVELSTEVSRVRYNGFSGSKLLYNFLLVYVGNIIRTMR